MTATGPTRADLDPVDRELLVSRVVAAALLTEQDGPRRSSLLAGAVVGLALVAALSVAGVILSARLPGPGQAGVGGEPMATAPDSAPASPSPMISASPTAMTWDFGGQSFTTPAGWHLTWAHRWTAPIGPIAFLANTPVSDPCSTQFLAYDACWKPLEALPADGVLVTFSGSAGLTTRDMWGKVTTGAADASCASLGGDEQMGAVFDGFGVSACLRGPDLASGEAAFREVVASLLESAASR